MTLLAQFLDDPLLAEFLAGRQRLLLSPRASSRGTTGLLEKTIRPRQIVRSEIVGVDDGDTLRQFVWLQNDRRLFTIVDISTLNWSTRCGADTAV